MKKKAKKSYLKLYEQWMQTITVYEDRKLPTMPKDGLCESLNEKLKLFIPTYKEYHIEGFVDRFTNKPSECYWAATGSPDHYYDSWMNSKYFSPMRQTIVLLLAAMNNEL